MIGRNLHQPLPFPTCKISIDELESDSAISCVEITTAGQITCDSAAPEVLDATAEYPA